MSELRTAPPSWALASLALTSLALLAPPLARAAPSEEDAVIEFHLEPVANLQLAIWLEDAAGNFIADVFVTQAVGKLGIGNRSGDPLWLSSWRAPYGPRLGALPVWAHRRGGSYPKVVFHDPTVGDHTSQGYHETSSSPESYFCRPLTPEEDAAIVDVMSCPSPATFRSDKGRLDAEQTSVYPPRNDLTTVDANDSPDVALYAELNDLDAVSGATPAPGPLMLSYRLEREAVDAAEGPLVAWIEVSLERDENEVWSFERDADHVLDESVALQGFGREFLGQPALVYRVEFDPSELGYSATGDYAGYADLYGESGELSPPDASISTTAGSGADRLRQHERFGAPGRFGVYSHGWGSAESGASSGCATAGASLPAVDALSLEALDFDTVRASFRVPELPPGVALGRIHADWITPALDPDASFDPGAAKAAAGLPRPCAAYEDPSEGACVQLRAGDRISVEIDQLFGNYSYSIALSYTDPCGARSALALDQVTTPAQAFTTLDGACFVATAAYGVEWSEQLRALRWFRDAWLLELPVGADLVRAYYGYGPILAGLIRDRPLARGGVRALLRPVAELAGALAALSPVRGR